MSGAFLKGHIAFEGTMAAEVRWLTQEVLVGAQSGWMQKKLHKHVGGDDQDKADPQQCWENTVEEQPGEQQHSRTEYTLIQRGAAAGEQSEHNQLTCSSCCRHSCSASDNDGQN